MSRFFAIDTLCRDTTRLITSLATVVLLLFVGIVHSKAQTPSEQRSIESILVKSHYYVASFTNWPEDVLKGSEEITFCMERGHFLHSKFSSFLPKKKLEGRSIKLQFLSIDDKQEQRDCNIIALDGDFELNKKVIANVSGFPVLTMSSEIDITKLGGIVFIPKNLKLKAPKISIDNLKVSTLTIAPSLLNFSIRAWEGSK